MLDLSQLNRRGLIPGPEESEEAFFARCERATSHPEGVKSQLAERTYDVAPDWVPVVYSDKHLRLWEGGCTWIEEDQARLQLKKVFKTKKRYLGLYSREELIAHELVHVVRQAFEEPIFEEFLAYHLSTSPFRRLFGPLFRSTKEVFLALGAIIAIYFSVFAYPLAIGVFGGGLFRLLRAHRLFAKTRSQLTQLVGQEKALAVMLRLTDREITRFARMNPEEIQAYANKVKRTNLRWQQLIESYPILHSELQQVPE